MGRPIALFFLALGACGGPEPAPPSDSGAPPVDLVFDTTPDPRARTDCATDAPLAGEARAKVIACAAELIDGALAAGRIGDLVLENDRARFVIRASGGSVALLGGPAGTLVDAAPRGGTDFVKEIFPSFDLEGYRASATFVADAGGDEEARVRVLFESAPIPILATVLPAPPTAPNARGTIDYVLRAGRSDLRIEITTTTAAGVASGGSRPGLVALLGGQEEVEPGVGVLGPDLPGGSGSLFVAERPTGALAIALDTPSGSVVRVDTVHLVQGRRISYARGASTASVAHVATASTAAGAHRAVADPTLPSLRIAGAPGDRVEIASAGVPVLRTTLDAAGEASVPLAPGTYALRAGFGPFFEDASTPISHAADQTVALPAAPRALLRIAATAGTDATAPCRVTVERAGAELLRLVAAGPTEQALPPGEARVTVSHGLEHDAFQADVVLVAGGAVDLSPVLDRVLDTTGWASVDLHLHSEASADSTHPLEDALRMIAAEGVDAASSTDHDVITDYPALAARAGIAGRVVLVSGEEVSTTVYGHVNGYPLAPDPALSCAGAVSWFDRTPREVFDGLRARGDAALGGALVQVNHPRLHGTSFFDVVGLDATGHATADPVALGFPAGTDLDDFAFDVVEVWNGYTRGDNERAFEDYLALLAAGRRFAMVGNSDSHRASLPAGSPRTFVRVADETRLAWPDLAAGLRARDATVAAGVFVTATVAGPRAAGSVPIHVVAQAPPWAPTDRLRIYAGRTVAVDRALPASSAPLRLDEIVDVPIGVADDFVVVRVDGSVAPTPMQHFPPFGVTNPIPVP